MEFATEAQKACYERLRPMFQEIFGDFAMYRDDFPAFAVQIGSAFAQTGIYPWGDEDAVVATRAYVVTGAELAPELLKYLLTTNNEVLFGAFGIDEEGGIYFEHTIVGSSCDRAELKASVLAVVRSADHYDDQIIARWGGQSAVDRMQGPTA